MALSNHLAQGGQTFLHQIRMLRQVVGLALRLGGLAGSIVFIVMMSVYVPSKVYSHVWKLMEANMVLLLEGPHGQMTNDSGGIVYARERARHPVFQYDAKVVLPYHLKRSLTYGGATMVGVMGFAFVYWLMKGHRDKRKQHLSGVTRVEMKTLRHQLMSTHQASTLTLGPLPLVKDSETQHMLITGTTGSGKTTCFHTLLPQLRDQQHRAVIVDTTGEFVARYYRPGQDLLLNPLDARSMPWHPWAECTHPYHYTELAEIMIPQTGNDPFWSNGAREIFTQALIKHHQLKDTRISSIMKLLLTEDLYHLGEFLKHTPAYPLVDPKNDRTASSLRSTLSAAITSLTYLEDTQTPQSIRQWVQTGTSDQWVFLVMTPEQRALLRPLISAWTSIALKALLGRTPDPHHRLWFILDELPSLNTLNDLTLCLAESRKYGGCAVLGFQNLAQLEELYGPHRTKSIIDLCSTKVLFRVAGHEIASRMSFTLGEQEIMEVQEGISYGANDVRDGVSLSMVRRTKPVVSPEELLSLGTCDAYVKLAGHRPVTQVKFPYASGTSRIPAFVPKDMDPSRSMT